MSNFSRKAHKIWSRLLTSALLCLGCSLPLAAIEIPIDEITQENTIIVFAHQDDDLLWMQPMWKKASRFVLAAVPTSPGFQPLIDQHQVILDDLGIEANYRDNWLPLWGSVSDREFAGYYWRNRSEFSYLAEDRLTAFWPDTGYTNFEELEKLLARLEPSFADPKIDTIVTHNPWGEYGHQHHRLVNQAVTALAVKYGKDVWVLGSKVINGKYLDLAPSAAIDHSFGSFNGALFDNLVSVYRNTFVDGRTSWTGGVFNPTGQHIFLKTVDKGQDVGSSNQDLRNAYREVIGREPPPLR